MTVTLQVADTPFAVAVMVAVPAFLGLRLPFWLTVTTDLLEERHFAAPEGAVFALNVEVWHVYKVSFFLFKIILFVTVTVQEEEAV